MSQRGIALIQVLIITFVLSLLGLYINQSVGEQVKITTSIQNKFLMRLELEKTEADLLQALLSNNKYPNKSADNSITSKWNFYGKEFQLNDNAYVTLTDLSSLMGLNISDATLLKNVLLQIGVDDVSAREFVDSLADWKDKNDLSRLNGAESAYYKQHKKSYVARNGFLQDPSEVALIRGGEQITPKLLNQYFTTEIVAGFNPLNAPQKILNAFINDENNIQKILQLREQGALNSYAFYKLTGVEADEYITFATGSKIKVQLRVIYNGAQLTKTYTLDATPQSYTKPMVFSHISWNKN
ncbi:general secretion pathway protein GspK [Pseudoalteromonas distincta]|uniref:general secretion pathway protein GspK n=1 Tax=Pseudoalteromonas distincta TaxID=77608 RepID=UPI00186A09FE|nr:type II secretion system protein GspK [Pseudoalteromonas distincta]MBE3672533.1 general secretion pathway protein K [Pseudoalteromonas distincta KMM 3548]